MRNIVGIIISFVFIFAIIFSAKLMERFSKEASRKTVHILVSNWWLLAMLFFESPLWASIVPACFVVINYLSYRYKIFSSMERSEGASDLGTVYYAISLLVLSMLTFGVNRNPIVGAAGILIMGYGDGFAAVVGKNFPLGKYKILGTNKTLSGSVTMFIISAAVASILFLLSGYTGFLAAALFIAIVATITEGLTPLGFDNLTVPLISAFVFNYILSHLM